MVKSPIKIIDSGTAPTTENLGEGQIAFGTVDGTTKLYGSDGTTVTDLTASGGQGPQGPQGEKGDPGPQGPQGDPGPQGEPGADGAAATVTVGTTTTGEAGTEAAVTNSGTTSAAVLNFTIPKGAKGDKGDKGDPGDPGEAGTQINSIAPLMVSTPSTATSTDSVAIGNLSSARGNRSISIGFNSDSTNQSIAIGYSSSSTSGLAIGGSSTATGPDSAAVGSSSTATGSCSTAIGSDSSAAGDYSTVLGNGAGTVSATELDATSSEWGSIGQYSVAIGYGSVLVSGEDKVVSFGNGELLRYYQMDGEDSVTSVIARGPETRRLIHVTDPINPQDAATKNYVDTKISSLNTRVNGEASSITAGKGISITGTATAPVVNGMIAVPDWANMSSSVSANEGHPYIATANGVICNAYAVNSDGGSSPSLHINEKEVAALAYQGDGIPHYFGGVYPVVVGDTIYGDAAGGTCYIDFVPYKFVEIN